MVYVISGIVIFLYETVCFFIGRLRDRDDHADVAWGAGFVISAWILFAIHYRFSVPIIVILTILSIWGLRLSIHIGRRNLGRREEDKRYQEFRENWKTQILLKTYIYILASGAHDVDHFTRSQQCNCNDPP